MILREALRDLGKMKRRFSIVGRDSELRKIMAAVAAGRHVLLEGPVGVGKTFLASCVASYLGRGFIRVDGDDRMTESKLIGYWDPPTVLAKGYVEEAFVEGPLTRAARTGSILFINELNRLPESAQNALLPVMDEGIILIPHLGEVRARKGFLIIATQNPEESVGVGRISEALRDRFVLVRLDYQPEEEEIEITRIRSGVDDDFIVRTAVGIARATRDDPAIRRGASVRSAIDMAALAGVMRPETEEDWVEIASMVLGPRIEVRDGFGSISDVIRRVVRRALGGGPGFTS
ncbi:MAG: MoxR family ATPase [Thermoproteota archaeon]|nr:MAG: MoxR family ATPase [Candidatus Korarchaeota archaeon]